MALSAFQVSQIKALQSKLGMSTQQIAAKLNLPVSQVQTVTGQPVPVNPLSPPTGGTQSPPPTTTTPAPSGAPTTQSGASGGASSPPPGGGGGGSQTNPPSSSTGAGVATPGPPPAGMMWSWSPGAQKWVAVHKPGQAFNPKTGTGNPLAGQAGNPLAPNTPQNPSNTPAPATGQQPNGTWVGPVNLTPQQIQSIITNLQANSTGYPGQPVNFQTAASGVVGGRLTPAQWAAVQSYTTTAWDGALR